MGSRRQSGGWGKRRRAWRRGRRGELQRRRGQRKGGEGWERRGGRQGGAGAELHQGRGRFWPLLSEENIMNKYTAHQKSQRIPDLAKNSCVCTIFLTMSTSNS